MVFKLALKNLLSAGLRTWLTAFILSLTLAAMLFMQALMAGMLDEMSTIRQNEEIAGGQIWHEKYDPFDPTVLEKANAALPNEIQSMVEKGDACPLLMISGAIYPKGRFKNAMLKGINPNQECLKLDFTSLNKINGDDRLSVMIGKRYADTLGMAKGDILTIRWRTRAGAFDAVDAEITSILRTNAPVMDQGAVYLSHEVVNKMNGTLNHSTLVWVKTDRVPPHIEGWVFRDFMYLMKDTLDMVKSKQVGQSIFYGMLLFLGLIAVFDTQALAVFRRKKEIGTFMAMGMSNAKVVYMFVIEGTMYGIIATFLTLVWAGPLFWWLAEAGMSFGGASGDDWGMAFGDRFFPVFTFGRVFGAILFVNLMVIFVSFWPTKVITRMLPANALRGRIS